MRQILSAVLAATCLHAAAVCAQRAADHAEAMHREHAGERPAASPAAEAVPRQEVVAREVVYGQVEGRPVRGYHARPAAARQPALPGVVLIHEYWGLNDDIRSMARRLAGEGYQVLATTRP